jgi:hypothetical protein
MTFVDWYASNVAPKVEAQVKNLPTQHREPLRAASRAAMAECWNAALDAVHSECGVWPEVAGGIDVRICKIGEVYLTEVLRA